MPPIVAERHGYNIANVAIDHGVFTRWLSDQPEGIPGRWREFDLRSDFSRTISWTISILINFNKGNVSPRFEIFPQSIGRFCIQKPSNSDDNLIPFLPIEGW